MSGGAPLRVGIVGGGGMGAVHARAWTDAGHRVGSVLERDPETARRLAQRTGSDVFDADDPSDVATFLRTVDAVSVCTPPASHADLVIQAIDAGCHVLLEKPSARTVAEHDRIAAAERAAPMPVQVMVGTTSRFYPEALAAKRRLRDRPERVLGMRERVRLDPAPLPDWYFEPSVAGGGVMLTNGIHAVDRMAWLVDATEVRVVSCSLAPEPRRETFAQICLVLDTPLGPVPATLQVHWLAGCIGRSDLEIARARDVVFVETWDHYRAEGDVPERLDPYPVDASFEQRTQVGIAAEIDVLVAAIRGTRPLEATLGEHRVALGAIEEAYGACTVMRPGAGSDGRTA